jgi:antimicrobial peptide system SdpB family protein
MRDDRVGEAEASSLGVESIASNGSDAFTRGETGGPMLTRWENRLRDWVGSAQPWSNVLGVARTSLAIGTLLTLVFSETSTLFRPATGMSTVPVCGGPARISLFCMFPSKHLELARLLAIIILAVVASGWRPRFTGILHWWVAFSLQASATVIDGGDQVTSVLALLLLPLTATDSRKWHWEPAQDSGPSLKKLIALFALWAIRLQVAGIYFHASTAKFAVTEWSDGTGLYYWLTDANFGAPPWLMPLIRPLVTHPVSVTVLTWSVLILELFLMAGLVMPKRHWGKLLIAGLALHGGIALVHGLVSFAFAMAGALVLYLRPMEDEFRVREWVQRILVKRTKSAPTVASKACYTNPVVARRLP